MDEKRSAELPEQVGQSVPDMPKPASALPSCLTLAHSLAPSWIGPIYSAPHLGPALPNPTTALTQH